MADETVATEETPTADVTAPTEAAPADTPESTDEQPSASGTLLDAAPSDGEPSAEGEQAETAAPETYELNTGEENVLGDAGVETLTELARNLDLSNEAAQQVHDMAAGLVQASQDAANEALAQQTQQWAQDVQADKDFGGDRFDATVADYQKVMHRFADAEFVDELKSTGFANHPGLVRMIARIGQVLGESKYVDGDSPADVRDPLATLYPADTERAKQEAAS